MGIPAHHPPGLLIVGAMMEQRVRASNGMTRPIVPAFLTMVGTRWRTRLPTVWRSDSSAIPC